MESSEQSYSMTEHPLDEDDVDIESSMEPCNINGQNLILPSELCDNPDILCDILNTDAVKQELSPGELQELKSLLPTFADNNEAKKDDTLQMLLSGQNFCFGNPVQKLAENLQKGFYNPEIAATRRLFAEARRKDYKKQQKAYYCNLLQEVLVSRQRLLETALTLAPGQAIRVPKLSSKPNPDLLAFPLLEERAKKRYYEELAKIPGQLDADEPSSDEDENYPEGPFAPMSKKQRRYMYLLENSYPPDTNFVRSTFSRSPIPESEIGEKTEDVLARDSRFGLNLMADVTSQKNPYDITDEMYKHLLKSHQRMRREDSGRNEGYTKDVTVEAVVKRVKTQHLSFRKPWAKTLINGRNLLEKKTKPCSASTVKNDEVLTSTHKSPEQKSLKDKQTKESEAFLGPSEDKVAHKVSLLKPKSEPLEPFVPVKIKKEVEENEKKTSGVPIYDRKSEMQASFFCVIRDLLYASSDRSLSLNQLQEQIKFWTLKPTSATNSWYTNLPSWSNALPSALLHLAGNDTDMDFVPYVVAKAPNVYQWIGVGRDSDSHLTALCQSWLETREASQPMSTSFPLSTVRRVSSPATDMDVDVENCESGPASLATPLSTLTEEIFPPRCPTSWVVQASTDEEKDEFRQQERTRYSIPHKAFTYQMHGYESTVGPLKGVYANTSLPPPAGKSRGHVVLNPERPHCVTILSLVRDAVARLPNGEGTRADICELLKDSQYLSPTAELTVQSVVSGALDRLHGETDPCVKYDSGRKIWIYLHRHRTEKEFELVHQQQQGLPIRTKRSAIPRKHKAKTLPTTAFNCVALPVVPSTLSTEIKPTPTASTPSVTTAVASTGSSSLTLLPARLPTIASLSTAATAAKVTSVATTITAQTVTTVAASFHTTLTASGTPNKPQTLTLVSGTMGSGNTGAAQVQTFQIATSTGIQTIRVSAPAHLSPAVLARTLQLSATQPAIQAAVQKLTGGNPTARPATLSVVSTQHQATRLAAAGMGVAVSSSQTVVRPGESLVRVLNLNRAARPVTSIPTNARVMTIPSIRSASTVIRPPAPSAVRPATPVARSSVTASVAAAVTTPNTVRLAGRQSALSVAMPPGTQTILIRPTQTPGKTSTTTSASNGPRLVMINPSTMHGKTEGDSKMANTMTMTTTATSLGTFLNSQGKPVMARVVGGTGGQQMLSLESLLSLAAQQKGIGGAPGKAGVVQVPLTALAGLQTATGTAIRQGGSGGTTLLVQGMRGTQQVLLPAGFQGVNIRGLQTVQGLSGLKNVGVASVGRGVKQPVIARVVNPVRNQTPVTLSSLITPTSVSSSTLDASNSENGKPS